MNASEFESPEASTVRWGAIQARTALTKDRRLEGETYLEDGYGLQLSIKGRTSGWSPMGSVADIWQPSRLKGITVGDRVGVPFFSAGQMFEERPVPRKWLAPRLTPDLALRKVNRGQLLLSCSGVVGNAMVASSSHENSVVTHDLLRVDAKETQDSGWMYGYMRTSLFKKMATSARYGHMIKHLEPEHVRALPYVTPTDNQREHAKSLFETMQRSQEEALSFTDRAHRLLASFLDIDATGERIHTTVSISKISAGRRRLDAEHFRPGIVEILAAFDRFANRTDSLAAVTTGVWWPNRFKRNLASHGMPYVSASEVFDRVMTPTKYIYASQVPNADDYTVIRDWILMARSGQVYGLNGRVKISTKRMEGLFVSEDLIRIRPDVQKIDTHYLLAFLGHPLIGRPMVIRNAYGTSIPHLEPRDILDVPVPRFDKSAEEEVARHMQLAVAAAERAEESEVALVDYVADAADHLLRS